MNRYLSNSGIILSIVKKNPISTSASSIPIGVVNLGVLFIASTIFVFLVILIVQSEKSYTTTLIMLYIYLEVITDIPIARNK